MDEQYTEQFKELYQNHFGKPLDEERASSYARRFLRLFEIIYTPMRREEVDLVEARNKELGIKRLNSRY